MANTLGMTDFSRVPRPFNEERTVSSTNGAETTRYSQTNKKMELDPHFTSCTKIDAKLIKGLNIRATTRKL